MADPAVATPPAPVAPAAPSPAPAAVPPAAPPAAPTGGTPPAAPPAPAPAAPPAPPKEEGTLLGNGKLPEKPGEKKDPAAPAAPADPAKPQVPAKYELKPPQGSPLSAAQLEKIAADARSRGLSNEQAQSEVERAHGVLAEHVEGQRQVWTAEQEKWRQAIKANPEFGGDKLAESAEDARRFLDRFGSKDLRDALDRSGLGDHAELFYLCARAGRAMREDKMKTNAGAPATDTRDVAEKLFGDMIAEQKRKEQAQ